jgi:hemolysin activation/secretion protein
MSCKLFISRKVLQTILRWICFVLTTSELMVCAAENDEWVRFPPRKPVVPVPQTEPPVNIKKNPLQLLEPTPIVTVKIDQAITKKVAWSTDKTTRITTYYFSDGQTQTVNDLVLPVSSPATYKDNVQTILTTYGDGSVSSQTNLAVKQNTKWTADKQTKSIIYYFQDGSKHTEQHSVPPKLGFPTYIKNTMTQWITYGDGSIDKQTIKAISENIRWSDDKQKRITTFTFPDGSSHQEEDLVLAVQSAPTYLGDEQHILINYGDGTQEKKVVKALRHDQKWLSDKVTRINDYVFPDGTTHQVKEEFEIKVETPIYKGNQQITIKQYPDGTAEKLVEQATSVKTKWATDKETKITTYEFADGSLHQELALVKRTVAPALFLPQQKIILTTYGDGTTSSSSIAKTNEEEIFSKSKTSKTVKRTYADASFHIFEYLQGDNGQWVPKMASVADDSDKTTQVFIKEFSFSGNTVIATEQLKKEVANWVNKSSDLNSLGHAVLAISNFYKESGWLAVAELPEQSLSQGVVQIKITEAKFGGVNFESSNTGLVNPALPMKLIEAANDKGQVMRIDAVEAAALMISELPGIESSISLMAGERDGETQISLELYKAKNVEFNLATDNAGSRSSGQNRQMATMNLNGLYQLGETIQMQTMKSEGSEFTKLGVNQILHHSGLRIGINTTWMKYQLITPEYMSINAHGPSKSVGLDLLLPIIRTKNSNLNLQFNADDKNFTNETSLGTSSKYKGRVYNLLLEGSTTQWIRGDGITSAHLQLTTGDLDFSQSPDQAQDAAGLQLAGKYQKFKISVSHAIKVNARNNFITSYQKQWATKNLDGSEKIYLGGKDGVRAYPTNEAGGTLGQLLNIEWQHSVPFKNGAVTLASFYDEGKTTINKFNDFPGALEINTYKLKGAGFWWGWTVPNSLGVANLKLTWARRMGINPAKNLLGLDQDGSYVVDRFWLSLLQNF